MRTLLLVLALGCSDKPAKPAAKPLTSESPAAAWSLPAGWKSEIIPFPLDFAPTIQHTGIEELRFPPGFFDPAAGDYWSYAFVWRTTDAAALDAAALGNELQLYFRGLITAVDEKKQQVKDKAAIVASATGTGPRFELTAHVFDAFKTGQAIDLVGWAERRACEGGGALWVFVLAPQTTTIRARLDELAKSATCAIPTAAPAKSG